MKFQDFTEQMVWREALQAALRSGKIGAQAVQNADDAVLAFRERNV